MIKIINEHDEYDEEHSKYKFVHTKSVMDSDGFWTEYTWYKNKETGENVFVFGDSDIYRPEDENFDWVCDSDIEAKNWFDNYKGFEDDESEDSYLPF